MEIEFGDKKVDIIRFTQTLDKEKSKESFNIKFNIEDYEKFKNGVEDGTIENSFTLLGDLGEKKVTIENTEVARLQKRYEVDVSACFMVINETADTIVTNH